jgi:hypothetical protein
MIKFPIFATLAFVLIALLAWSYNSHRKTALRTQRQAQYQATLADYSRDFQPGQTRAQVETLLQSRNVAANEAHVDSPSWDKFIKIGQEHSDRLSCSHDDIDIRLTFTPSATEATPADTLTQVTLYRWPQNCL